MKRAIASLFVALLFGCRKHEPPTPAEPTMPAAGHAADPAAPGTAPAVAPGPVEITLDLMKRYVVVKKEILELSRTYTDESLAATERVARSGAAEALKEVRAAAEREKEFKAKEKALHEGSGIGAQEFRALDDLFDSVTTGRMVWRQQGGDAALQKLEADLRTQLAGMPPEQRAAAEPELAKLTQSVKDLRDGGEARKKYGDVAVDLLLQHGAEIEMLKEELFKAALKRR